MTFILDTIISAGFSVYLYGFSAIDFWLGRKAAADIEILTNAGVTDLAHLFEKLRYPGISLADAALDYKDTTLYFRCADDIKEFHPSFNFLEFYQNLESRVFYDPCGIYHLLTGIRWNIRCLRKPNAPNISRYPLPSPLEFFSQGINPNFERTQALMDAALILAKYFPTDSIAEQEVKKIADLFSGLREDAVLGQEEQRVFLTALMNSINPGLGLELLKTCGFIGEHWQELAILDEADHSKDFHPEGNAWKHTMETFRYRKDSFDLRLSLGLLLHDAGKPIAVSTGSHRFDGHAELGEVQARKFLGRLGFGASLINDVGWMVRNHMLPAALPRLPLFRTAEIMSSDLFPTLLELYRCDESSSFKGLDGYYESAAAYQTYLRNRRNPYRSENGKKLKRGFGKD